MKEGKCSWRKGGLRLRESSDLDSTDKRGERSFECVYYINIYGLREDEREKCVLSIILNVNSPQHVAPILSLHVLSDSQRMQIEVRKYTHMSRITTRDISFMCMCLFLRQPILPSVVSQRYAQVIPLPQSRDGCLWEPAKASVASTKLFDVFLSQGPSELQSVLLQPGLSAACLCPV